MTEPLLKTKMEAIQNFLTAAAKGITVKYGRHNDGREKEPGKLGYEFLLKRTEDVEEQIIDFDNSLADPSRPRVELSVTQTKLHFQLKVMSRSQDFGKAGWAGAQAFKNRMKFKTLQAAYLQPVNVAFGEATVVMDETVNIENRQEDVAVIEMYFWTAFTEFDEEAAGTYIDAVELTSNFEGLPASMQLDKEVNPWA